MISKTLRGKRKRNSHAGRPPALQSNLESQIVQYALEMDAHGFGLSLQNIRAIAQDVSSKYTCMALIWTGWFICHPFQQFSIIVFLIHTVVVFEKYNSLHHSTTILIRLCGCSIARTKVMLSR